jgi:linoleate 8R-lipoxygenase / 9,12-octadecadienoate 8-hydroperoxide 8R-isomerase
VDGIDFLVQLGAEDYGQNDMLGGDGLQNAKSRQLMGPALYPGASSAGQPKSWYPSCPSSGRWIQEVKSFYEDITLQLLHQNSYQIAGVSQVDIVKDISNIAQVHFA